MLLPVGCQALIFYRGFTRRVSLISLIALQMAGKPGE